VLFLQLRVCAMFLQAAQAAVQPRPKFSPALLNMRHIERTLAFQKEFTKADKVPQQAVLAAEPCALLTTCFFGRPL
jgi:hypothetical protein